MRMSMVGTVVRVEDKVSKKGNEYTILEIVQEDARHQYFSSMLDKDVEIDKEVIVGKEVELFLDYNPRYRNFKIDDLVINK